MMIMDIMYNGTPQERKAFYAGMISISCLWFLSSLSERWKSHKSGEQKNDNDPNVKMKDKSKLNKRDYFDTINEDDEHECHDDHNHSEDAKESIEDMEYREMIKKALRLQSTESAFRIIYKIVNETKRFSNLSTQMIMRERWPWESLRKSTNEIEESGQQQHHKEEQENNYGEKEEQKNDTCIGSIFGLDVGGTLSKLLYFEEKPSVDFDNNRRITKRHTKAFHFMGKKKREVGKSNTFNDEIYENDSSSSSSNSSGHCEENNDCVDPQFVDTPPSEMTKGPFIGLSKEEERQQALERFYRFVRQLDTIGSDLKDKSMSFYSRTLGGEFHFIQFETRYISQAMDLIKVNDLHLDITNVGATGGGAHKYAEQWDEKLGIKIDRQGELDSLVTGMQFILADVVGECYTFLPNKKTPRETKGGKETSSNTISCDKDSESSKQRGSTLKKAHVLDQYWWSRKVKRDFIIDSESYPYLLVMIGTGVSVLRVDGTGKHERISGSTIGGGTYWGLCRLLTDAESFDSVLGLAERGDPSKVDM